VTRLQQVVNVPLPTPFGVFEARVFESDSELVHLALVIGGMDDGEEVLTRLHSECLTGDAFGSLRCDCGVQLRTALRAIGVAGQGVLVYATGHEGRGIGLVNKLRSYVEQDQGADTVEANLRLGLPVDVRDYGDTAGVLVALGVRSVRLLTNNPAKVEGLRAAGVTVTQTVPIATSPHTRNGAYLHAKERLLGHHGPAGSPLGETAAALVPGALDTTSLVGEVRVPHDRPYVVLKFAQTLDGRIATATGDAKWISGEEERRVSHALRAACDGVLVGVDTVIQDDPQLTVRMVPGVSPTRVVLDSTIRVPDTAKILEPEAATTVITTDRSPIDRRAALGSRGVRVEVVRSGRDGVDLVAALGALRHSDTATLLVEGGARVITSMLAAGVVDRLIVGIAPLVIGQGTEAVRGLGVERIVDGIRLVNRSIHALGDDVLLAWDVAGVR
jgi:GTP cyclohydrolase II